MARKTAYRQKTAALPNGNGPVVRGASDRDGKTTDAQKQEDLNGLGSRKGQNRAHRNNESFKKTGLFKGDFKNSAELKAAVKAQEKGTTARNQGGQVMGNAKQRRDDARAAFITQ